MSEVAFLFFLGGFGWLRLLIEMPKCHYLLDLVVRFIAYLSIVECSLQRPCKQVLVAFLHLLMGGAGGGLYPPPALPTFGETCGCPDVWPRQDVLDKIVPLKMVVCKSGKIRCCFC